MLQLVIHHTYLDGSTFDVSGKGNHGWADDVVPGVAGMAGSYEFAQPTSGILVPAAPTLENLGALRVRIKVRPVVWDGERRNLIEGHVSFVLLFDTAGRLGGGIVDGNGQWTGVADTAPTEPDRWHEVELVHDGLFNLAVKLNGRVVAAADSIRGPVRSVGPLGLAIGRWPDANQYVFKGHLGEVQVWRWDPVRTALAFLDCCCKGDRALLDEVIADLRDRGVGWRHLQQLARTLQQDNLDQAAAARAAGQEQAGAVQQLYLAARTALSRRDGTRLAAVADRARLLLDDALGPGPRGDWEQRVAATAESLGWPRQRLARLARMFCLDASAPPTTPDPVRPQPGPPAPWDDVRVPEPFPPPD
jgi:hypothetical protein